MEGDKTDIIYNFLMILPNKAAMSVDILELIQMSLVEKRKNPRQQLIRFLLS